MARRVVARRVVASAAELVRGSNRNPLRTTPGKARRGSLKNFASRFARLVFHGYLFVIRYQYLRYQISVLVSFISAIGIYVYIYWVSVSVSPWCLIGIGIGMASVSLAWCMVFRQGTDTAETSISVSAPTFFVRRYHRGTNRRTKQYE